MLTLAVLEALAPDQAALTAARKMVGGGAWPVLGRAGGVVWGEAQGSGSAPYRVCAMPGDRGSKCSCPSRKFPCKHALALMWLWVEQPVRFAEGAVPGWVSEWMARRRPGAVVREGAGASAAVAEAPAPADPEAETKRAKAAAAREEAREADVAEAIGALETWIADQLHEGLAGFPARARAACRGVAQRLVDGKAAGLALMVDELPGAVLGVAEAARPAFVMQELGRLVLIAAAYRRQGALPAPLRSDVRRAVGWSQRRDEVLADPAALRVRSEWIVVGGRGVVQADRLRRVETWMHSEAGPAVLLDFVPVAGGAVGQPYQAGERFEAELVFYASAAPLRAIVAARGASVPGTFVPGGGTVAAGLAAYWARVAALPWLGDDLLVVGAAELVLVGGAYVLRSAEGALPVVALREDGLMPLLGLALDGAAGVWDGRGLHLLAAGTALGPWFA